MTAPAREFVDSAGWPIVDRLLADALRTLVEVDGRPVRVATAFVADDITDVPLLVGEPGPAEDELPAIRVQRLPGGGINNDGYQDTARVEVMSYGRTRPESDDLTAQIRRVMAGLSDDEWAGVGLDTIREDAGPGRVPDLNRDIRAVPTAWVVIARNQ